jgi:hypothetical protein
MDGTYRRYGAAGAIRYVAASHARGKVVFIV